MGFVHLRMHTEYSVADGTLRIDEVVAAAAANSQGALAITDLSNLFGAIKLYRAARAAGVKPILGAELCMAAEGSEKTTSRLPVLVQDHTGYLNLCQLLSRAWLENAESGHAVVRWEWLRELGGGLIALSGAEQGSIGQALAEGDEARARTAASRLATMFPRRFYIELQRVGARGNERHVRAAAELAAALSLPVVATHPVQFLTADDYDAHEARVCVADGEMLANPRRKRRFTPEQYFKSQAQMEALFADLPSALANSVEIARRCNLSLVLGQALLPDFATPPQADGSSLPIDAYFRLASRAGLEARLAQLYPEAAQRERERPRYVARLEFEIETILKMGFPGYFLIVADFINWAQNNGCPVGPGRGSGAGSLVAYSLNITGLDPLRYDLIFERFLNPERVSMPDFDIDFCQANRDRVIDYVKQKYGREAVSQIVTFGTMAAKAALRDIGRVLGMSYGHVDSVAKLVPAPPGKVVTLRRPPAKPDGSVIYARREAPELEQREKNEEEVAELLALAERVEGLVRNVGMHAGGVLIAPGKLTDFCPLYMQPGSSSAVSQYDKDDVEAIGLVKFDFLGLATLTILELAKNFIVERHPELAGFSFDALPLDDPQVYALFSEGRTESVFQFESAGMRRMLKDARPSRIEDLFALNAMFRPGPMENIPSFCARKHGREAVSYPHPLLETVLGETYGIMVYQEQVMQTAQLLGGYSLGGADLLRRAMGKKKAEEMAVQRAVFRSGAAEKAITAEVADEVFDLMEKFAGYGFNKSHAAAYSLLAYQTAWLKVHHPAVFFAANMTVEIDNSDKLKALVDDAKGFAVTIEPPDVNLGGYGFAVVGDHAVRYGLGAVKGTGQGAIEAMVAARVEGGPFVSVFDFCARVDRSRINRRVVEALIKAGAFDRLHGNRATLLAGVGLALDWAETQAAHTHQVGLFDFGPDETQVHGASTEQPALNDVAEWSVRERLMAEKAALGFYLSGHLFDQSATEVRSFAKLRIAEVIDSREVLLLAGIVADLRIVNGMRGRVAIFKLDDMSESIEAVANEELLNANRDLLKDDELVIVQGKVQPDRFTGGVRFNVNCIWDLATARCRFGKFVRVEVNGSVPPVAEVLREFPLRRVAGEHGDIALGLPVRLALSREAASAELDLGDSSRFFPSEAALARWSAAAAHGRARVVYE
ncbi:MAG: DNA polymerase III subunit alpha [Pseudomonadota bacterium]|nr:DNA polymerase III subunit alpha [Pseudomonadota bacterium]